MLKILGWHGSPGCADALKHMLEAGADTNGCNPSRR